MGSLCKMNMSRTLVKLSRHPIGRAGLAMGGAWSESATPAAIAGCQGMHCGNETKVTK